MHTDQTHACSGCTGSLLNPVHEPSTAQQRFNSAYINSSEIAALVGVSRTAILHARQRGLLPDPIVVNDSRIYVWEREAVAPYITAWHNALKLRRGQPVVFPLGVRVEQLSPDHVRLHPAPLNKTPTTFNRVDNACAGCTGNHLCRFPLCKSTYEQEHEANEVHAQLYGKEVTK